MSQFQRVSIEQAHSMLQQAGCRLADIRDPVSFAQGHVPGAFALNQQSLGHFLAEVGFDTPVLVMCYHGHSSQGAAQYLAAQGYEQVYSVDGGFADWGLRFEVERA